MSKQTVAAPPARPSKLGIKLQGLAILGHCFIQLALVAIAVSAPVVVPYATVNPDAPVLY